MEVRIRRYAPGDFGVVRELYVAGMYTYCPPGENEKLREYVDRTLGEDMAESGIEPTYFGSGGHFWVATVAGDDGHEEIVGSIAIQGKGNGRGELRRLSVKDSYRRQGLARKLVAHLESWARDQGWNVVELNTGWEMAPALQLYESLGYKFTHKLIFSTDPYGASHFYEKTLDGRQQ